MHRIGDDGSVGLFSQIRNYLREKEKKKRTRKSSIINADDKSLTGTQNTFYSLTPDVCSLRASIVRRKRRAQNGRQAKIINRRPYLRVVSRRTAFQQRMRIPSPRLPSGRSFRGGNKQPNLRSSELLRWGLHTTLTSPGQSRNHGDWVTSLTRFAKELTYRLGASQTNDSRCRSDFCLMAFTKLFWDVQLLLAFFYLWTSVVSLERCAIVPVPIRRRMGLSRVVPKTRKLIFSLDDRRT